jgi:hypothetical protein
MGGLPWAPAAIKLPNGMSLLERPSLQPSDAAESGGLFEQARFPADKRPVKLHNVQLALGEFMRAGLSLEVGFPSLG